MPFCYLMILAPCFFSEWGKHTVRSRWLQRSRPLRVGLAKRGQTGRGQGEFSGRIKTHRDLLTHAHRLAAQLLCLCSLFFSFFFCLPALVLQRVCAGCRLPPHWLQHHSDLWEISSLLLEPGERCSGQKARPVRGLMRHCFPLGFQFGKIFV